MATVAALLSTAAACWFCDINSFASVKDMKDIIPAGYLKDQFQWTLVMDLPDSSYFLHYPKSKIWPLTRVRADFKSNVEKDSRLSDRTYYEELWYHEDAAVGLRRHNNIYIPPSTQGALVVCPGGNDDNSERRAAAIVGSIIRLSLDVQFRNATLAVVLVPESEFDTIKAALANNHFKSDDGGDAFYPLSAHLISYPGNKEATMNLQN